MNDRPLPRKIAVLVVIILGGLVFYTPPVQSMTDGHGRRLSISDTQKTNNKLCTVSPNKPASEYSIENLKSYIEWRFQEEYDPHYRVEGVIQSDTEFSDKNHSWTKTLQGGLTFTHTEVFEFPSGQKITRFDTMQTRFAREHTDIREENVPRFIQENASVHCNGNLVLFSVKFNQFSKKEKEQLNLFVNAFKEYSPSKFQKLKERREKMEDWISWLHKPVHHYNYEDALLRLERNPAPPKGSPDIYRALKQGEERIQQEIEHLKRLRNMTEEQLLRYAQPKHIPDLLNRGHYMKVAKLGDYETLKQLYSLSRSTNQDTSSIKRAAIHLMNRLPSSHFSEVDSVERKEIERAIRAGDQHEELDSLWERTQVADQWRVKEIKLFRDWAIVDIHFVKGLDVHQYTEGVASVFMDQSDRRCNVCRILNWRSY